MDDLKLYAKSEEETNMLVRSVHIFSTNIGMEFGIKFGILTMKRSKIVNIEGKKLPHGDVMKHVGQEGLPNLGIIETTKEYKRSKRLILKSKFNGRNKSTAISS